MAEDRVQRRLAAILAADVVGFSRLMEMDEVGTLSALKARRHDVLGPLVSQHHGRVVKVMGDGVGDLFLVSNPHFTISHWAAAMPFRNDGVRDH